MFGSASIISRQALADLEHDVFFAGAARPARARILAAVSGIDRDDDVARLLARARHLLDRSRSGFGLRADRRKVDDEAIAVSAVGGEQETAWFRWPIHVEHDAHRAVLPVCGPDTIDGASPGRQRHRATHYATRRDVDDDAVRIGKGKQLMFGGLTQVECNAGLAAVTRDTHALNLHGSRARQAADE